MDDEAFLEELERAEGENPARPNWNGEDEEVQAPNREQRTLAASRFPVHHENEAEAKPPVTRRRASLLPAFLTILIGLSAGGACSVLVFHDRVTRLLAAWSR